MRASPRRRHRKPRHARPRATVRARLCRRCLPDFLELVSAPSGWLLFLQQPGHWLNTTGSIALLSLGLARRHARHRSDRPRM
ncbi:hypothetical protein [Streptomyces acidiscabies]|uniref:Uncharacterized protein n=1 Tax=Streptomyces acidiscabies TaxID=42234 RepID=A0AAP6BMD5_9ACTN|nr:hypothetical protein [Streptomyces acidiscabies]MBP5935474.1 hypothetical protein [Streptomyces sp. LBUM 1476]MBZ3916663.1 hypothetical protein [Streptomyces acidiscabies]MDX2967162.1 hypothetical protein [Streptomyces acidiscabies]MDX3025434.1 hypothetical protein [Streptomyces acidiscabies]MDX3795978.1 hypothetical protein [Streptomyces acidiscabies]